MNNITNKIIVNAMFAYNIKLLFIVKSGKRFLNQQLKSIFIFNSNIGPMLSIFNVSLPPALVI